MKLFEILQDSIRVNNLSKSTKITPSSNVGQRLVNHGKVVNNVTNKLVNKQGSVLGSGMEAVVFQSNRAQDVGVVTKWIRNQNYDAKSNPSIQYFSKGQYINSMYIPKVYKITQFNRPNGIYEFALQMEKLPLIFDNYIKRINQDPMLMRQLLIQVFTEDYVDALLGQKGINYEHIVTTEMEKGPTQNTSPRLIKTLNFLKSIVGGGQYDITGGNMMIRLTQQGPQLVITDPFAVV